MENKIVKKEKKYFSNINHIFKCSVKNKHVYQMYAWNQSSMNVKTSDNDCKISKHLCQWYENALLGQYWHIK